MKNKIVLLSILLASTMLLHAQEFQSKVTVIANRVPTTVDKKIFTTLQNQLTNLINNRKWTRETYKQNEKIECSFLLNVESTEETNVYKASLTVQAARPVFNSSYKSALVNFMDADVLFKYVEYQPVEFNESRVQGSDPLTANLTAVFAYYAYMILGLDADSFTPKGGDAFYIKAQNIVNNAPEGKSINGWRAFDGLRNRYWLVENLVNPKYNIIHDVIYTYYRSGLDKMYDSEEEGRSSILQALVQFSAFSKENINTMVQQFFVQGKSKELIGVFTNGQPQEKSKAIDLLSSLDVANSSKYKEGLK